MQDHVIGIDIGTTGTKVGIYDREGRAGRRRVRGIGPALSRTGPGRAGSRRDFRFGGAHHSRSARRVRS